MTVIPTLRSFAGDRPIWRHALLVLLVPFACLSATKARAQEGGGDWQVMLGGGAIYAPDYEGSDDYEIQPFPLIWVEYRDLAYIRGPEVGFNLLRLRPNDDLRINFGPLARYRRDRPEDRNDDLTGLGDVDLAVEVGGALSVEYHQAWLRVSVAQDVAGGHEGLVGEGEAGMRFNLADRLTGSVSARASWADSDYMDAYFSVSPTRSAASGLPLYQAGSGIKDAGAGFSLSYGLGAHWMLTATGSYTRLLGDAADAPLVMRRGSPDQWQGGLFLAYRF